MPKDKSVPLSDFKAWRKRLRSNYQRATSAELAGKKPMRPREASMNVMKLDAYRYYRQLAEAGLIGDLRASVEKRDGTEWHGHGDGEELWVLRLLAARGKQKSEQSKSEAARARKERSRMAAEFKLAALNNIRPKALLGFLYEAGPIELIQADAKKRNLYAWAKAYQ